VYSPDPKTLVSRLNDVPSKPRRKNANRPEISYSAISQEPFHCKENEITFLLPDEIVMGFGFKDCVALPFRIADEPLFDPAAKVNTDV
jgi:hypothetical protein